MNKQLMMNWLSSTAVLTMLLACGPNSTNSGNANVPQAVPMQVTAMQTQCLRSAAHESWWDQYKVQPYQAPSGGYTPQTAFPNGNICGCPTGTMPTCSAQGLVCVPMSLLNGNVATWYWSYNQNGGPGFQPNPNRFDPYWHPSRGGGRGGEMPERIPRTGAYCPMGYQRDFDGDECIRMHRFGPEWNGGAYGYAYAYAWVATTSTRPMPGGPAPMPQPQPRPQPQPGAQPAPYPNNSCQIGTVAQICDVVPGQGPVNGMICQRIATGSLKGIWVRQQ